MATQELEVDISRGMCLSLRCTLDTRNLPKDQRIFSSEFQFGGGEWKLGYYKWEMYYNLRLHKCSGVSPDPFHSSVHVESSEDGRMASVLPQETRLTTRFKEEGVWCPIWQKREDEILRSVPEFRLHGILRLIVVLRVDSTSTLFSSAASVPTTSNDSCLEGLSHDFSELLDHGPNPDVEFQCGGKSTKAHGAVVSARSQVIAKMLATDMVEGRTKIVEIPDMGPDAFEKFLRYLYTGKLDGLTFEVALSLFEAGDQYGVTGLAKRCSEYLVEHLSVRNACEVLVIADAHRDEGLVEKVVEYMVHERVPVTFEAWPAFCGQHPSLAINVLNRGWNAVVK